VFDTDSTLRICRKLMLELEKSTMLESLVGTVFKQRQDLNLNDLVLVRTEGSQPFFGIIDMWKKEELGIAFRFSFLFVCGDEFISFV